MLVTAVLTVQRAAWERAPDCLYVIEVFTAHVATRRGLARAALVAAASLHAVGEQAVAPTVSEDNVPARALYAALGFRERDARALYAALGFRERDAR